MDNFDKLIDSLNGIEKAQPSTNFTQKVMEKWEAGNKKLKAIPKRTVWAVAASLAFLLALNIWVGAGYKNAPSQSAQNDVQGVVNAYELNSSGFSY